jgi:hypothetical protein
MIETLGPIRQSSPIAVPAVCEVITQPFAISTLRPIVNGPSVALTFVNEAITDLRPIERRDVISTSALGLIRQPYLR